MNRKFGILFSRRSIVAQIYREYMDGVLGQIDQNMIRISGIVGDW